MSCKYDILNKYEKAYDYLKSKYNKVGGGLTQTENNLFSDLLQAGITPALIDSKRCGMDISNQDGPLKKHDIFWDFHNFAINTTRTFGIRKSNFRSRRSLRKSPRKRSCVTRKSKRRSTRKSPIRSKRRSTRKR
jgi:hypothetical protein